MPSLTLKIKIDCDNKPSTKRLNELGNIISQFDFDYVLYDHEFEEHESIDWDKYIEKTNVLSA